MNLEQQRTAIAELRGWEIVKNAKWLGCTKDNPTPRPYPPYSTDLNAMHDAEGMLSPDQRDSYTDNLWEITARYSLGVSVNDSWGIFHATAPQRSEAFLRTLGKWVD